MKNRNMNKYGCYQTDLHTLFEDNNYVVYTRNLFRFPLYSRILEEPLREDMTGGISSVSQGTNLTEMTFHEIANKLQQLLKSQQSIDHRSLMHLLQLGFKIADTFEGQARAEILESCNDLDGLLRQHGNNQSPEVKRRLAEMLSRLKQRIEDATINRIILDMADIATPLKQFSDVVSSGENRYFSTL